MRYEICAEACCPFADLLSLVSRALVRSSWLQVHAYDCFSSKSRNTSSLKEMFIRFPFGSKVYVVIVLFLATARLVLPARVHGGSVEAYV